jgi:sortase A
MITVSAPLDEASRPTLEPAHAEPEPDVEIPPLGPRLQMVRAVIIVLLVLATTMLFQLLVVSGAQHSSAQHRAFDALRGRLANTTAPIGPTDVDGHVLAIGTPLALMQIPKIGLSEVVGEGTTPSALFAGPGHRRDTPLPGQIGTSIVFGRRAAFGGPFGRIDELAQGDIIKVTTGQGQFQYRVRGVRYAGDPLPPPPATGKARLVLVTAAGATFLPNGVVRVDADLFGDAVVGAPRLIADSTGLSPAEQLMAGDSRTLWVLAMWLQALIVLSVAAVFAWHRWGKGRAWVVFLPPLLLVGSFAAGEAARLLPNLM